MCDASSEFFGPVTRYNTHNRSYLDVGHLETDSKDLRRDKNDFSTLRCKLASRMSICNVVETSSLDGNALQDSGFTVHI